MCEFSVLLSRLPTPHKFFLLSSHRTGKRVFESEPSPRRTDVTGVEPGGGEGAGERKEWIFRVSWHKTCKCPVVSDSPPRVDRPPHPRVPYTRSPGYSQQEWTPDSPERSISSQPAPYNGRCHRCRDIYVDRAAAPLPPGTTTLLRFACRLLWSIRGSVV